MKSNLKILEKVTLGVIATGIASDLWSWLVIPVEDIFVVGALISLMLSFFVWLEGFLAVKWQAKGEAKKYKIGRGITSYISLVGGKFATMGAIGYLFPKVQMLGYFNGVVVFFGLIFLIMGFEAAWDKLSTSTPKQLTPAN
ncbi:hypothetical protein AB4304_01590 [Vibrio breoganii]|uniref:hypothetical protein n=1 Tax=Vibrio breoganii TaxID=553239 RepID=UPI000C825C89|nr:hypothetical protein [Vibrio breoganii]PMK41421.1 hypothetical protein BCU00_14125 [Vibrio breoganii]PMO33081.1 hypothetical protein BCT12_16105 [Vibrio breoganii]